MAPVSGAEKLISGCPGHHDGEQSCQLFDELLLEPRLCRKEPNRAHLSNEE